MGGGVTANGDMTSEGSAIVTGASRGIGAAIAQALAADGWTVGVNYRSDADGAAQLAEAIADSGGHAVPLAGDVRLPADLDTIFGAMEAEHGPVLVLVNNAGVRVDGLAPQIDDEAWAQVVETNLSAAFRATRRALRPMLRARFGRIVNVASVVGPRANAGQANYAAAKAGLIGMTKTVAVEVARRGITVNAVAPGLVETKLTEGLNGDALGQIPARRTGTPEEVAACVRFLASPEASYVTGTTLTVDGGLSA
jgi:3-oxoacyl-[acyl-carrier protein] reductase